MTRKLYLLTLLIGVLLTSCKKSEIEYENSYEKSHRAWQNFKKESNNTYLYTTTGGTCSFMMSGYDLRHFSPPLKGLFLIQPC